MPKPKQHDTTAPYTFKRGDLVRFELPGKGPRDFDLPLCFTGIGVIVATEVDGSTYRDHVSIWTGHFFITDTQSKVPEDRGAYEHKIATYHVPTSRIKLIDVINSVRSIDLLELADQDTVDSIVETYPVYGGGVTFK